MLSAKEHEIADEVQKLKEELLARKNQLHELQRELLKQKVDSMGENQEVIVMFESEFCKPNKFTTVNSLSEGIWSITVPFFRAATCNACLLLLIVY